MAFKLVIGDKNWSSWSLRSWLLMKQAGIVFDEIKIRLRQGDTQAQIAPYSPSGWVPVLLGDDGPIWDSLAIAEYLADLYPEKNLWPQARDARALARSISAEMHSGFVNLRREMPMDCLSKIDLPSVSTETRKDIARIQHIWQDCRGKFGQGGAFLFGGFSIADAMFAPVVSRFFTYGVALDDVAQCYADTVMALPAMQEWLAGAGVEEEIKAAQG